MKRFTGWTTALAATALLAGPVAVSAQQTSPAPASRPAPAGEQGSAHEHLNQAKTALNDIPAASLTGTAKTSVAELKRRLSTLEKSAAESHAPADAAKPSARAASSWGTEVAAIDRILNELLGADSATGAAAPTGTTGSKSAAAVALDDAARTKLQDVRTHVTAFAAAMSGNASASSSSSDTAASATPAEPAAPAASAASASTATTTTTAARPEPTTTEPTASAATAPQSATTPSQAEPAAQPAPAQQAQVDPDTVKRHLTAARDSLSQITQLPAAAQLTGDARTQVSQLIANFNELITTTTEWRASYAKVQANLTALVGDQAADESPATPATGTPGAVGTSGTVAIDPTIKAKLMEFRTHLLAFEKAAGGAPATSLSTSPSQPAATSAPSAASTTSPSEPAAATTSTAPTAGSTAAPAAAAGTTGTTSSAPAAAATASTTTPTEPEQSRPSTAAPQSAAGPASQQSGHADAMRHIEAIDAILNGRAAGSATAGTTGTTATVTTLDRDKIEQIKTHLAELRRALAQSGGR